MMSERHPICHYPTQISACCLFLLSTSHIDIVLTFLFLFFFSFSSSYSCSSFLFLHLILVLPFCSLVSSSSKWGGNCVSNPSLAATSFPAIRRSSTKKRRSRSRRRRRKKRRRRRRRRRRKTTKRQEKSRLRVKAIRMSKRGKKDRNKKRRDRNIRGLFSSPSLIVKRIFAFFLFYLFGSIER